MCVLEIFLLPMFEPSIAFLAELVKSLELSYDVYVFVYLVLSFGADVYMLWKTLV